MDWRTPLGPFCVPLLHHFPILSLCHPQAGSGACLKNQILKEESKSVFLGIRESCDLQAREGQEGRRYGPRAVHHPPLH